MIAGEKRAEVKLRNALLRYVYEDPKTKKSSRLLYDTYAKGTRIYQGYVAPNTFGSASAYIHIQRISANTLDKGFVDGVSGDTLRRVRLQIDVYDKDYGNMVERAEHVKQASKSYKNFIEQSDPNSITPLIEALAMMDTATIDDESYGIKQLNNTTWNITSIDVMITESED